MKSNRNRMLAVAAFGLIALCASAKPAAAQGSVYKGSFRLTNEVLWQNTFLPKGDYTLSLKSAAPPNLIEIWGPNGGTFVLPVGTSEGRPEGPSEITIELRGGSRFVRDLYLADLGIHLKYSVPKAPKEELLTRGPETTEHALIVRAGK